MGKIITAKRKEGAEEQALNYVKSQILFPAGMTGLLAMVVGVLGLVYQLFAGTYDVFTFAQSSGLILAGIILGWGITVYHKFILREHPEFFASRMRKMHQRGVQRLKKRSSEVTLEHAGRGWIPVLYLAGITLLIGLSSWAFSTDSLHPTAAFALPWAGFFWGKMFAWRGVIDPPSKARKK